MKNGGNVEKISVIVPAYNVENQIERCIRSILSQTYSNLELIVIDDGSADKTFAICEQIAAKDGRVRPVHQKNAGPAAARNRGMAAATGMWLMFVDSDDWIEPDCILKAYQAAAKRNADLVLFNMQYEYGNGRIQKVVPLDGNERIFSGAKLRCVEDMMLTEHTDRQESFVCMSGPYCKLIKKGIIMNAEYPESLNSGEDACFVYQILKNCGKMVYIADIFYHRIVMEDSLSMKTDLDFWKRRMDYVNWVLSYFKEEAEEKKEALNYFCYENYKLVVWHYFMRNIGLRYAEKKRCVLAYRQGVRRSIAYGDIRIGNRYCRFLIRHGMFWALVPINGMKNAVKRLRNKVPRQTYMPHK